MLFWALGVLIVLFANFWRRMRRPATNVCRNYIVGGTLVGMLVGMLLGYAGMIGGAVVGAALGAVAWSRTPSGHASAEPLLAVFARIGLPAVVTMSIAGLALDAVANA